MIFYHWHILRKHLLPMVALCTAATVHAQVTEGPFPVGKVVDGDTISVVRGGALCRVRLLYIDTPESKNNRHGRETPAGLAAKEAVTTWLPLGTAVWLWSPKDAFGTDLRGRLLAVVLFAKDSEDSLQGRIISAGWSPLYKRFIHSAKDIPDWLAEEYNRREVEARSAKRGAWALDPEYMNKTTGETPSSPPSPEETDALLAIPEPTIAIPITAMQVRQLKERQSTALKGATKAMAMHDAILNRLSAEMDAVLGGQLSRDSRPARIQAAKPRWDALKRQAEDQQALAEAAQIEADAIEEAISVSAFKSK